MNPCGGIANQLKSCPESAEIESGLYFFCRLTQFGNFCPTEPVLVARRDEIAALASIERHKIADWPAFVWMLKTWTVNLPPAVIVGVQASACCFRQCGRLTPLSQRVPGNTNKTTSRQIRSVTLLYRFMKTHRKINRTLAAFAACILLSVTGCRYDGSFFNMSSNSGSPFFGLQLAVDSGSRPPRSIDESDAAKAHLKRNRQSLQHQRYPEIPDFRGRGSASSPPILLTRSSGSKQKHFETTSETRDLNSNVRYSLQTPTSNVSLKTESIDQRLSAF